METDFDKKNRLSTGVTERLEVLFNINQTLTSTLNIEEVLNYVLEECVSFFQSDTGMILLYDEEKERLIPHNYYGINDKAKLITIEIGEGISGKVFQRNEAILHVYPDDVQEAMKDINADDKLLFHKATDHWNSDYPYSVMCAPLMHKNKNLGVLTLDFLSNNNNISKQDVRLFQIIASQAAIAYQNAIIYENEKKIVEGLNHTLAVNTRLSNEALQGKGIDHICETISSIIRLPVCLFDSLLYTRFRSDDFDHPAHSLDYVYDAYLYHNSMIIKNGFAIYPIKKKNETLGFFIIEIDQTELHDFIKMTIEHGLNIIALELIKEKEIYNTKIQIADDIVNEYFIYEKQSTFIQQLEKIGVENSIPCFYIIFDQVTEGELERIYNIIYNESVALTFKPLLTSKGVIFFTKQEQKGLEVFLNRLMKISKRFHIDAKIFVGRMVNSIVDIETSYNDTLSMASNDTFRSDNIVFYDDLSVEKLFLELKKENMIDYVKVTLKHLINSDSRNKQLLKTLVTYIQCNKNPHEASVKLHIHINTLYYRLKLIERELNIHFSDQENWLNVHLAVKLLEITDGE